MRTARKNGRPRVPRVGHLAQTTLRTPVRVIERAVESSRTVVDRNTRTERVCGSSLRDGPSVSWWTVGVHARGGGPARTSVRLALVAAVFLVGLVVGDRSATPAAPSSTSGSAHHPPAHQEAPPLPYKNPVIRNGFSRPRCHVDGHRIRGGSNGNIHAAHSVRHIPQSRSVEDRDRPPPPASGLGRQRVRKRVGTGFGTRGRIMDPLVQRADEVERRTVHRVGDEPISLRTVRDEFDHASRLSDRVGRIDRPVGDDRQIRPSLPALEKQRELLRVELASGHSRFPAMART